MKINDVIRDKNNDIYRVVHKNFDEIFLIDLDKNKFPFSIPLQIFNKSIENGEFTIIADKWLKIRDVSCLNEKEKIKLDKVWEIIMEFFVLCPNVYNQKERFRVMKELSQKRCISFNTLKTYFINYLKGGQTKSALVSNYCNCGGRGKEKKVSDIKRGKPSKSGINIDEKIKKQIQVSLNKYYYSTKRPSLKQTYEMFIRDYFSTIDSNGSVIVDIYQIPTYNQFLYWSHKLIDKKKEVKSREGARNYDLKYRAIIGSSSLDCTRAGELWQLDATVLDCYLVSEFDRSKIIGRPVLYFVVDVYSRNIVGCTVTLEALNSYNGTMIALLNAMTDKVEYCSKYGVQIDSDDWIGTCIPTRILADRGELMSQKCVNIIQNLGIIIQNTPPYRADLKGVVEQLFNQIQNKIKPFLSGVVDNPDNIVRRGAIDYRLKANLTLYEITTILIKSVIWYNNFHLLSKERIVELALPPQIKPVAREVFKFSVANDSGMLRTLDEDFLKMNLLPISTATITSKGIKFNKLYYVSDYIYKEKWLEKVRNNGVKKINISYNPFNLNEIYYIDSEQFLHTFYLSEWCETYLNQNEYELNDYLYDLEKVREQYIEQELKSSIKLINAIEEISATAKNKSDSDKAMTDGEKSRLKGIDENSKKEREFFRKELSQRLKMEEGTQFEEQSSNAEIISDITIIAELQNKKKGRVLK